MSEIHKIEKNGVTIYPATTTDAVVDADVRKAVKHSINNVHLSDIFLGDSNLEGIGCGSIIDLGIVSLPENYNKELYLAYLTKSTGLVQIKDSDGNVVAQFYKNEERAGIEVVEIASYQNSGVTLGGIINWDAIGKTTSFGNNLHINKNHRFVGRLNELIYELNQTLEGLDLTQYNYILYNVRKWAGESTAGLDIKKQEIYKDKILGVWGKCNVPLAIINVRNETDTLFQICKQDDPSVLIAQYFIRDSTSSGIQSFRLTNQNAAPEGTELYAKVNWDNITSNFVPLTNKIDILFLPENEITDSIDNNIQTAIDNSNNAIKGVNSLNDNLLDPTSWENGADFSPINNSILDVWNDSVIDDGSTIYLGYVRSKNALIQFWSEKDNPNSTVAQFFPNEGTGIVRKGTEIVDVKYLNGKGHNGESFKVLVNWDATPENVTRISVAFPLSRLRTYMNYYAYKRLREVEKKLAAISFPDWFSDEENNQLSINVFGDVMSKQFKDKWFAYNKDLEIILLGDSIVGLQSSSGAIPEDEAKSLPPGCQYYHWTWGLYTRIVKNKPVYNRADSDIFTKTGTFEIITSSSNTKLDQPSNFGEWSVAANTYQCNAADASVQFTWDLSKYEKLNIIHSLNPDGAACIIQIGDGSSSYNGKVLVSTDKSYWIEANNFAISQNSNPDNLNETQCQQQGYALHQRHRRIWMKRVESISDTITVTFKKTEADTDRYMYFWGTERWNGYTTVITNLGRGGRNTNLLNMNISDVIDRNPDLVIHSLSLANETAMTLATLQDYYNNYFFGGKSGAQDWEQQRSMLIKSENYTKFSYLILMPHGRGSDFVGDTVAPATIDNTPQYFRYRIMAKFVKDNMANYENVSVIELFDQMLHEGKRMGMTFEQTLIGTSTYPGSFTSDGIHLNRLGSAMYTKYLSPLFDLL